MVVENPTEATQARFNDLMTYIQHVHPRVFDLISRISVYGVKSSEFQVALLETHVAALNLILAAAKLRIGAMRRIEDLEVGLSTVEGRVDQLEVQAHEIERLRQA